MSINEMSKNGEAFFVFLHFDRIYMSRVFFAGQLLRDRALSLLLIVEDRQTTIITVYFKFNLSCTDFRKIFYYFSIIQKAQE